MISSGATAKFEITPTLELEDLFLHFSAKVCSVPAPRSLVEAGFIDKEIEELREWFVERWELPYWCDDGLRQEAAGASRQEMIGALILILATAQCREHADEDSVWPAATKSFRGGKAYPTLFVAGQPTASCKRAMAAGVRRLGLRNSIDRHGKQEYFDTLRLQFGFTRRGAEKRLPEWLAGLVPLPVKILSGEDREYIDLRSESFSVLWKALKRFRDNQLAKEYTRFFLRLSRGSGMIGLRVCLRQRQKDEPAEFPIASPLMGLRVRSGPALLSAYVNRSLNGRKNRDPG